jgi:hypothetical protein
MIWKRLTALAISSIVAIPTFEFVSAIFDSEILGLIAASMVLIPLLGVMSCLLDPCGD